ncbi:MAG TPA: hypothetical protein VGK47_11045 [Nitrososphaeraceae archaeon]|jgi:hypothetical protein
MSKAQRIDDHSAWMGSSSKDNPLPMETKMKTYSSEEGVGGLNPYEDKEEDIKAQQAANNRQQRKNPFGPGQRN